MTHETRFELINKARWLLSQLRSGTIEYEKCARRILRCAERGKFALMAVPTSEVELGELLTENCEKYIIERLDALRFYGSPYRLRFCAGIAYDAFRYGISLKKFNTSLTELWNIWRNKEAKKKEKTE